MKLKLYFINVSSRNVTLVLLGGVMVLKRLNLPANNANLAMSIMETVGIPKDGVAVLATMTYAKNAWQCMLTPQSKTSLKKNANMAILFLQILFMNMKIINW